jgi:hypothetical protein
MKLRAIAWLILASAASLPAQAATLADKVFAKAKGSPALLQVLSPADRQAIASLLPLKIGANGSLVDKEDACDQSSEMTVVVRDLNGDGRPEVIVGEENACAYGMRGGVTRFLASDGKGHWREILTGDGLAYEIKPAKQGQWPVILPGVMGFCYPVFSYSEATGLYQLTSRTADPKMPNACKNIFGS